MSLGAVSYARKQGISTVGKNEGKVNIRVISWPMAFILHGLSLVPVPYLGRSAFTGLNRPGPAPGPLRQLEHVPLPVRRDSANFRVLTPNTQKYALTWSTLSEDCNAS